MSAPARLARWLWVVAAMVVAIVIVGGITRLTESGLSITEWKPVSGTLPPLTDAAWTAEFAKYRQTTEFIQDHSWMTMADFKFIFFWEWAHRLLGRLIGLALLLPLAWWWMKGQIPPGYKPRLLALAALVGLQGTIGWWMVASGLVGRTDVSHYRLAVHLMTALVILGGLVWTARDLSALARGQARSRVTAGAAIVGLVLALQLLWGAYVAGLNAGHAFSSWPLMGDQWFPDGVTFTEPVWRNAVDNPIVVQFIHRWWAFVAAGALIWLGIRAMRAGARSTGLALHLIVTAQILLGIATLMSGVSLWIAVSHQGVAALLVVAFVLAAHRLGSPENRLGYDNTRQESPVPA